MLGYKKENIYLELGNNLKEIRQSLKLSQEDFGSKLGLSRVSISNIEQGRQKPTIHFLFDLLITFDINLNDIFPFQLLEEIKKQKQINSPKGNEVVKNFIRELQE